jgi:hypothetical protein
MLDILLMQIKVLGVTAVVIITLWILQIAVWHLTKTKERRKSHER